jgi:hypothetical protein
VPVPATVPVPVAVVPAAQSSLVTTDAGRCKPATHSGRPTPEH